MVQRAVIYARVSTKDQDCLRQVSDLTEFAKRAGYEIVEVFTEKASGAKNDRAERAKVLKLAQARKIDLILVTEMSRWGRSTVDLIETLERLKAVNVSLIAQSGMSFDLSTAQGKMIATVMGAFAEYEKDLIRERVLSGLKAATQKGKTLGRPVGSRTTNDKRVMELIGQGRSYRWIAKELHISPNTVTAISKRHRAD